MAIPPAQITEQLAVNIYETTDILDRHLQTLNAKKGVRVVSGTIVTIFSTFSISISSLTYNWHRLFSSLTNFFVSQLEQFDSEIFLKSWVLPSCVNNLSLVYLLQPAL